MQEPRISRVTYRELLGSGAQLRLSLLSHIARHNCTSMSVFAVTQAACQLAAPTATPRHASKSLATVVWKARQLRVTTCWDGSGSVLVRMNHDESERITPL